MAEEYVLNQIPAEKLTTKFVREAFAKAALAIRCTNPQLHDYLVRERKKCAGVAAPVRKLTVACFMVAEVDICTLGHFGFCGGLDGICLVGRRLGRQDHHVKAEECMPK